MVYGVNPAAAGSHARFAAKLGLPFPLLVDRFGRIAFRYRAGIGPIVRRTVYVVGPDGTLLLSRRGHPPAAEILRSLEA